MANFIVNQATDDGTGLTAGTLSYAILQANQLAGDDTITIDSDVRVTGVVKTLVNSNITIVGNNHSVSGDANNNGINDNGDVRPLFILSGTVSISDLTITNGRAKGGDSGQGAGGAGLGGGLFIYDGNVSLNDVAFSNNAAQGGSSGVSGLSKGGGGLFGNGGGGGGGGLFADSTNNNGGYGGNGNYGGSSNGGFGGGGQYQSYSSGTGGFGGGGGGGVYGGIGFSGGFGGGGGYGFYGQGKGGYGGGGSYAQGGFGGGNGGANGGGGGAGLGGGIFVRSGSLTLNNTSFTNNTATGGTGDNSGQGLGGGIFIMQSTTNTNGNNQGMPTVLGTIDFVGSSTFSGNSAVNDAGTLTNNDDVYGTEIPVTAPTVSITAQTATANEGGSNGVYRLTRTDTTGDLTINLTIDGISTASTADYTLNGGSVNVSGNTLTVTIADGQSFVDLDLAAIGDIAAEAAETLKLNLDTGTGYTVDGTNNTATVTIAANDTVVTNTNDSGEGSLRQAILNANAIAGADTITFAGSVFTDATPDTITLTSGQLTITDDVTIQGTGANQLTVSGNNASSVFSIFPISTPINSTIDALTITEGNGGYGGAITNNSNLTITNSTISNSQAFNGGGIGNNGVLTIINSTISGNSTTGNSGGGIASSGTLTIINSTISGNTADRVGGGIGSFGFGGSNTIISSTITNNTAKNIQSEGGGGGIFSSRNPTVQNTIIAGNFDSGSQAPDISGAVTGNANNLIGSLTGASGTIGTGSDITFASAGITNINQVLGALADNGGATQTHALVAGSAAINAGNNALIPSGVTTDQRGTGFNRISGGTVDIGAYEVQNNAPTATNDSVTTNEDTAVNGNVLTNDTDPDTGDILTVSAVNGNTADINNQITLLSGALLTLNSNGTFAYNPNGQFESLAVGATASDSFTYTISDGSLISTATVNLTINGVNDAPTLANIIANQTTLEDGFFSFTVPTNTFADIDASDSLTYSATLANGNPLPSWLSFNANTRSFSGTPNDPDNGTISIKITATDTSNASVNDTFNLTVTPVNDAPVAGDDSASANQNTPLTLLSAGLLANDTDVDSSTLSISAVSNGVNGTVSLNGSGNVVFTPTTNFTGNGSFNYTVSDGNGGTDVAMVTVAVGVNLNGTNNNDNLNGTSGNDIINGLNAQDTISGNAGNDCLVGDNGDDKLYGGTGNDNLYGGNGQDTLYGDADNDRLEGDNGDDKLYGGDGNDSLIGGNGQDLLVGGAGNDFLDGDKGDDNLTGGTGSDIFVLEKAAGRETITDFSLGQGDKIGLSGLSFNQLSFSGNQISLGNQTLAVLSGFNTTTLTQSNFISV
ncbi:beta strand repeat-containing protein [Nostoc sp. CALU 546]|uniref:beta strand repeat-containing protein n=1 Tax=Nostoc sp. CALU 546 TaxID=1867241 RepID=UPI003B686064